MSRSSFFKQCATRNKRRRASSKSRRTAKRRARSRSQRGGGYLGYSIQPYATVIRRPLEEDRYAAPITDLYADVQEKGVIP